MRVVLIILILAIVAIIIAVATGLLDINQIRGARAPEVTASGNGLSATGGQPPAFDVQTGSIKVGTKDARVRVPTVAVEPPANTADRASNNAM